MSPRSFIGAACKFKKKKKHESSQLNSGFLEFFWVQLAQLDLETKSEHAASMTHVNLHGSDCQREVIFGHVMLEESEDLSLPSPWPSPCVMLVRDSMSRCTRDFRLTVTCYTAP